MGDEPARVALSEVMVVLLMAELSSDDMRVLTSVVRDRSPDLEPLLSVIGSRTLTRDEREGLRGALADELTLCGLDDADEPTSYGERLDGLIGRLMFF